MKSIALIFLFSIGLFVLPYTKNAHALLLRNLDPVTHTVSFNNSGEITTVTLEPGDVHRIIGPSVTIMLDEYTVHTRVREEWGIKKGLLFIIRRPNSGGF